MVRWFRDATGVAALGADHGLSRTTAYRYHTRASTCWPPRPLHLPQAQAQAQPSPGPAQAQADGLAYLTLDGTLVPADRLAERTEAGNHAWY